MKTTKSKTPKNENPKTPKKHAAKHVPRSSKTDFGRFSETKSTTTSSDDSSNDDDSDSDSSSDDGSVNSQLYKQAMPTALLKIPKPTKPKVVKPLQVEEEKVAKPKKIKPAPVVAIPKEPSKDEVYNPKMTVDAQYLRAERETWNLLKSLMEKKQDMINKEYEALLSMDWFPGMGVIDASR
jgi:hypothetical protein